MITRRPRRGDVLEHRAAWLKSGDFVPLGVVSRVDGFQCHYIRADNGQEDTFIWLFERDGIFNILIRIVE